nr:hypothetical protein [uncultured Psychroserpens sp.]
MEEINEKEFIELLTSEQHSEHLNLIINFENATTVDLFKITLSNRFINCKFIGKRLDFLNMSLSADSDPMHYFHFEACEFQNEIYFKECFLRELRFSKISREVNMLHIAPIKLGFLTFECAESIEAEALNNINIVIHDCEIEHYLDFLHLKSSGSLFINDCNIKQVKIHDCTFKRIDITHNQFSNEFQFTLNEISDSFIEQNNFEKSNFSLTDFGFKAKFESNEFKDTALFQKLKNEYRTDLEIKDCNFYKYTDFNNSKLYELRIDKSKFQEFVSFQELELNSIFLDRTIFEKPAFFDDIEILRFNNCNKRTLRNIKQQLLRSDNKIDYDSFRSHELNSYKEELKKKIKLKPNVNKRKLRRDLSILRVNTFFSNNGTDWVKALKRTVIVALVFYSVFFILHNSHRELDLFNISNYNEYFIGLFRYFLITDFHNPLTNKSEYLSSVLEWIPFILGKILIAIGIYEILVSFRKFKK